MLSITSWLLLLVTACAIIDESVAGEYKGPPECTFDVSPPEFDYAELSDPQQYKTKYGYFLGGPQYAKLGKKSAWQFPQQLQQQQQFQSFSNVNVPEPESNVADETTTEAPEEEPEVLPVWKLTMARNAAILSMSHIEQGAQTSYFFIQEEDFANSSLVSYSSLSKYQKTVDITSKNVQTGWYLICGQYRFVNDQQEKALCNKCHLIKACKASRYECDSDLVDIVLMKEKQTTQTATFIARITSIPFESAVLKATAFRKPEDRRCALRLYDEGVTQERTVFGETQTTVTFDHLEYQYRYAVHFDLLVRTSELDRNITLTAVHEPHYIAKCHDYKKIGIN